MEFSYSITKCDGDENSTLGRPKIILGGHVLMLNLGYRCFCGTSARGTHSGLRMQVCLAAPARVAQAMFGAHVARLRPSGLRELHYVARLRPSGLRVRGGDLLCANFVWLGCALPGCAGSIVWHGCALPGCACVVAT